MSIDTRVDTVEVASSDAHTNQPWSELGLKEDEYDNIREILGRRPTSAELAMYSVMWSEHCSYKSSKVHLAYFGETTTEEMRSKMLAGIGENAGVVDIGDGWAVTFKVESHNHPSYVEPYQGAATGVSWVSSPNRRRCTFEDLYEQCSDHITEYMASSASVGRRPRISRIRAYSSSLRPSSR